MKLEAKTMTVLKNFSNINPSLLFKEGSVIETISPNKTILAKATVPNKFNRRCAIYDLTKFLGGVSLAETPDVSFNESSVVIKDEKTSSSSSIAYASEATIKSPPEKTLTLPSIDVTIEFTENDFKNVIRAAGVYGLPEIAFVGDGSKVYFQAIDTKNPQSNRYSVPVGESENNFRVIFKVENLVKLMPGNYKVNISSKMISHFVTQDIEYWVAVETASTFS